jgi:hypothetical protein
MPYNCPNSSFAIVFICEPGELEIKSLLLAYSLRKNLKADYTLVVLIPEYHESLIKPETYQIFNNLNVEVQYFENALMKNKLKLMPGDAMSNKFYAIKKIENSLDILFLDSDIICLNTFSLELFSTEIAAKPADFSLNANWEEIYLLVGTTYPKTKIRCTVDSIEGPPYYNTGVVYLEKSIHENICKYWEEYFLFFSRNEILGKKLFNAFHRDQLAFALSVEKIGIGCMILDEQFNFPARKRNDILQDTVFAHYHDCYTIASSDKLMEVFKSFIMEYRGSKKLLDKFIPWKLVFHENYFLLHQAKNLKSFKRNLHLLFRINK